MILNWCIIYGTMLDEMQQTLGIFLLCFLCEPHASPNVALKYVVRSGSFF